MNLEEVVLAILSKFGVLDLKSIIAAMVLLREEAKIDEIPPPGRRLNMPQLLPVIEGLVSKGYVAVYQEFESSTVKYTVTKLGSDAAAKIQIKGLDELAKKYQFQHVPLAFVVVLRYPQYW
ncbi:MAG: hypothetical protein ACP5I3_03140 [Thermoproteus sp.]|jgi:hypothetical protein